MRPFLVLILFVAPVRLIVADVETWSGASPDKKFFAALRCIPDQELIYRRDLDGFRLIVYRDGSDNPQQIYSRHDFLLRTVMHIAWSPDSQFLLFTTASSGGHSPWHFKTFVFCSADKSFRDVETAAGGPVGAAEFRFEPPDIAVLRLHDPAGGDPKQIKLPLGKAAQQMEHLE